jgi:hypothetical protein
MDEVLCGIRGFSISRHYISYIAICLGSFREESGN